MSTGVIGPVEQALTADASLHDVLDLVDAAIESSTATGDRVTLDRLASLLDGVASERGEEWNGLSIAAMRARAHAAQVAATPVEPAEPPVTPAAPVTSPPIAAAPAAPVTSPPIAAAPAAPVTSPPIAAADGNVPFAGWWLRTVALFFDLIVLGVFEWIVGRALGGALLVAWWVLPIAYFAGMHAFNRGATAGKAVVGISVRRADGGQLGLGRALWRFAATFLVWITGIGGLVDMIVGAADNRNQWLHDKMAGTIVVHKRSRVVDIL